MPHAPDKAVTPLVPLGLGQLAPHVSAAALHIDALPGLPGMMAEHPRSAEAGAAASWGPTAALSPQSVDGASHLPAQIQGRIDSTCLWEGASRWH